MSDLKNTRVNGYYNIDGRQVPSVTTILGKTCPHAGLEAWKRRHKNHGILSREARIFGLCMHMRILGRMSDSPLEVPDSLLNEEWPCNMREEMLSRDEQWKKLGLEPGRPRMLEHTIYVPGEHPFAGTVDYAGKLLLFKQDLGTTTMDLKSSSKPQKSHEFQIGAYSLGLLEDGVECDNGVIPYVRAHSAEIVILEKEELQDRAQGFLEIAGKFYKQEGLIR